MGLVMSILALNAVPRGSVATDRFKFSFGSCVFCEPQFPEVLA